MTTATTPHRESRVRAARTLGGAFLVSAAAALVVTTLGFALDGVPAGLGGLTGGLAVAVVLAGGALVVDLVATQSPAASLLVAMLTYLLQVVLVLVLFVALTGSDAVRAHLALGWLAAGVIAAAAAWTVAQVRLAVTARIPLYDLPGETPSQAPSQVVGGDAR